MSVRVILPAALRAQIEREARAAYPRECCGLLEGIRHAPSSPVYGGGGSPRKRRNARGSCIAPPSASLTAFARHLPRKRGRTADGAHTATDVAPVDLVEIAAIHPSANLAEAADTFEIDPAAHIALLRTFRGTGRAVVGCYHSHPNGRGEPSERDRASASEAGFVWVIAALRDSGCTVGAFVFDGVGFSPLALFAVAEAA